MRTRRRYTREFKVEAVKLVRERGVTVAQAARDLGLGRTVLAKWVREFASDPREAFPGQGQQKPEQVELTQLRREVPRLKMERDILKKGSSRNTGKRRTDVEEEVGVVAVAVGHPLEDFDLIVDAFEQPGVERIAAVIDHPVDQFGEVLRKGPERANATAAGTSVPVLPEAPGRRRIGVPPELFEIVFQHVDDEQGPVRLEQLP